MDNGFEFDGAAKAQTFSNIFNSIMKDYLYKVRDMEPFFEQTKECIPYEADFFIKWFKGYIAVANDNFVVAQNFYKEAFSLIDKSGDYLVKFLLQAFALFLHAGDKKTAENFWNYGAKKGLFAKADDSMFQRFNAKEQFWVQFSPKMFIDSQKITYRAIADYTRTASDKLQNAIDRFSADDVDKLLNDIENIDDYRIDGISPLYYAIQKKGSLKTGDKAFTESLITVQSNQMYSKLNLTGLSLDAKEQKYLEIYHQMRETYEKSGLGNIMYCAYFGLESDRQKNSSAIVKIIKAIINKSSNVDSFVKNISGKVGTNALHLAAEINDKETCELLLKKGCDVNKVIGYANFGMNYAEGKSATTQIPNSFIYRLISFQAWDTLKMYLTDFSKLAEKSMTEKSEKCNITPLVYMILTVVYAAKDKNEFDKNTALVNSFIPLFTNAGSVLHEKTAFGTAKSLLGL